MALTNQQHFDRLGVPLSDRPGHTAACPRFYETSPWLCDCHAKSATEDSAEEGDGAGIIASRRITPTDAGTRQRLRPRVTMVSGPNVLREPQRWGLSHLRADRDRFGDNGPAARRRWTHFAAALIGAVALLAIAGAH